jgi:hypothetical protein
MGIRTDGSTVNMKPDFYRVSAYSVLAENPFIDGIAGPKQWRFLPCPLSTISFAASPKPTLWLCTDKAPQKTEAYLTSENNCFIVDTNGENI